MDLSPESNHCLSPSIEDDGPFALDRYREHLDNRRSTATNRLNKKSNSSSHPLTQSPIINMPVDGAGLRALGEITAKAEAARDEILEETASSTTNKLIKCMISGENRPFVDALYGLDHAVTMIAEEVCANQGLFRSIEPARTKAAYKQLCKAMRGLSLALLRMTADCGREKYIRICRKYVVRILRSIIFHYGKLIFGMEREVQRVWAGPIRYGDDVNAGSLLKARIADWLDLEPRLFDKLFCKGPERVIRRGQKEKAALL